MKDDKKACHPLRCPACDVPCFWYCNTKQHFRFHSCSCSRCYSIRQRAFWSHLHSIPLEAAFPSINPVQSSTLQTRRHMGFSRSLSFSARLARNRRVIDKKVVRAPQNQAGSQYLDALLSILSRSTKALLVLVVVLITGFYPIKVRFKKGETNF